MGEVVDLHRRLRDVTGDDAVPRLVELVVELVEALDAAHVELAQLAEVEMPTTDKVEELYRQHKAMSAALGRAANVDQLRDFYREEAEKVKNSSAPPEYNPAGVPVEKDVLTRIDAAWERLRVARLLDRELEDGMRGAVLVTDFAGC